MVHIYYFITKNKNYILFYIILSYEKILYYNYIDETPVQSGSMIFFLLLPFIVEQEFCTLTTEEDFIKRQQVFKTGLIRNCDCKFW